MPGLDWSESRKNFFRFTLSQIPETMEKPVLKKKVENFFDFENF